jgi:hypothetical protein
MAFYR